MFVGLSEDYDTVSQEALFGKMYQLGIRGRMLEFVKRPFVCFFDGIIVNTVQMGRIHL